MEFNAHKSFSLTDKSYASLIKKDIRKIAQSAGFEGSRLGEVEIVASELITNLIKHSEKGAELLVKTIISENGVKGIELISIDDGPGMLDAHKMLADGISTTGTLGQGLGAMKRLSNDFDIYSQKDWGTLVLCRLFTAEQTKKSAKRENCIINTVMVPKPGEEECGDGWALKKVSNGISVLVADGLGHGPEAHKASAEAVKHFLAGPVGLPSEIVLTLHEKIKKTRGMVGAVLNFNQKGKMLTFCGIGNINARVFLHNQTKAFVSYNGIIGVNRPHTVHNQTLEAHDAMWIILTSDGLTNRWDLQKHPQLLRLDSSLLAVSLYKDYSRRTDDCLVIVIRTVK